MNDACSLRTHIELTYITANIMLYFDLLEISISISAKEWMIHVHYAHIELTYITANSMSYFDLLEIFILFSAKEWMIHVHYAHIELTYITANSMSYFDLLEIFILVSAKEWMIHVQAHIELTNNRMSTVSLLAHSHSHTPHLSHTTYNVTQGVGNYTVEIMRQNYITVWF